MLTYVKINIVISLSIILITILSNGKICQAPIQMWLMVYVVLSGLDSLIKMMSIKFSNVMFVLTHIYILEIIFEFIQAGWLIYGNYLFVQESRECIKSAPMITYTFLFVLIVGFISLAKFAVLILAIIIWIISKMVGANVAFDQIFNDHRRTST